MEPKASTEFLVGAGEESEMSTSINTSVSIEKVDEESKTVVEQKASPVSASASASNLGSGSSLIQGEETVSNRGDSVVDNRSSLTGDKGRKSSTRIKNLPGKRKMKKYRSHRKHLLARESEAATWSRKRQMYGTAGRTAKRDMNSWVVPTTGFPPVTSMPQFRPLHVWGHPSTDQPLMYMWPNHPTCSPAAPPAWVPGHPLQPPISGEPSFWSSHHQDVPAPGMPCFPPHFQPTSTESIDAVIGDVLSKPWLPLPLGLKPPSIDSVVVELQRQGISNIPPTCA
ncbi:putative transcription factor GLK1 [Sesamum angolense]|uniref:Transcription factor GLK1 n=1 Tax=Sesamum angolense TaxID=2727404 RepID=A0AAE1WR56_9LAMI|nr:putative transcription factor GLK1 [Sesamum angolense]